MVVAVQGRCSPSSERQQQEGRVLCQETQEEMEFVQWGVEVQAGGGWGRAGGRQSSGCGGPGNACVNRMAGVGRKGGRGKCGVAWAVGNAVIPGRGQGQCGGVVGV